MSIVVRDTVRGRRYDVRVRDRDGVQHSKSFRTKREATDYEARATTQLGDGAYIPPRASATTVEQLAERWLYAGAAKRASTRSREVSVCRTHLVPGLGPARQIGTITRADCQALVDSWTGTGLAPRSVARNAATLRSMFQYAVDAELVARNPAARLRLPHADPVERPSLGQHDLERLADALGEEQSLFMWCGAILGLRWAEVAGLTAGALDPLRHTVSVRSQLDRHGQLVDPKTLASRRTLAAPDWLVAALADLARGRHGSVTDAQALVFTTPAGAPLTYANWRTRIWQPGTERAGLAGLRFHDLRSVAASALVAAGVDLRTAMHRLGHTTPAMTLAVYARVAEDRDRAAVDAIAARVGPRRKDG